MSHLLKQQGKGHIYPQSNQDLFDQGMDYEILTINGKQWQKGKLKVSIRFEFCPEGEDLQTSSPLDSIRMTSNL